MVIIAYLPLKAYFLKTLYYFTPLSGARTIRQCLTILPNYCSNTKRKNSKSFFIVIYEYYLDIVYSVYLQLIILLKMTSGCIIGVCDLTSARYKQRDVFVNWQISTFTLRLILTFPMRGKQQVKTSANHKEVPRETQPQQATGLKGDKWKTQGNATTIYLNECKYSS